MTKLRQAAMQALEALENSSPDRHPEDAGVFYDAMDALRAALEQPEQEPVAFYHPHKGFYWAKPTHISAPTVVDVPPVPLYVKWKAAQPEQVDCPRCGHVCSQRPWQGLTERST